MASVDAAPDQDKAKEARANAGSLADAEEDMGMSEEDKLARRMVDLREKWWHDYRREGYGIDDADRLTMVRVIREIRYADSVAALGLEGAHRSEVERGEGEAMDGAMTDNMLPTAEQQARDLLERMGVEGAQDFTSGDLVELANLIADVKCGSAEQ